MKSSIALAAYGGLWIVHAMNFLFVSVVVVIVSIRHFKYTAPC